MSKEMEFERKITITGGFDKRHPDPKQNYGIHGVSIRFVLRGELGATHFVLYTDWYPANVQLERAGEPDPFAGRLKPMGADIGYHSYKPMYEGQTPMAQCDILGCPCYYDGSSLQASEFIPTFLTGGDAAVWEKLEEVYCKRFLETE